MKVLVTGGAGYIGSTICSVLIDKGHKPIILDSLITGRIEFTYNRTFYKGDICDKDLLIKIFKEHSDIEVVVHCAGLVVVSESVTIPYKYYRENVVKSLELLENLKELGCRNIIFSSSASIYDDVEDFILTESAPLNPRSPYAKTKYIMEMILKDFSEAYDMKVIALRYFNIIGADPKMRSGVYYESPSHILGKLVDVALGKEVVFKITGVNWHTRDGSGLRDYIHVWDLAKAHVKAIENFSEVFKKTDEIEKNYVAINLGTGNGVTVKEFVNAFEKVCNKTIVKVEVDPRPGDIPGACNSGDKAQKLLGWKAENTIEEGICDSLKWAKIKDSILKDSNIK